MLDLKFIRESPDKVKKAIKDRNLKLDIEPLLKLDEERRRFLNEVEAIRAEKNKASKEVAALREKKGEFEARIAEMKTISQKEKEIDAKVDEIDQKIAEILLLIPNIPHSSLPIGPDPGANKIVRSWGKVPKFDFKPRTHIELAEFLDIIDFERATKITGSHFVLFKGDGARLERALINFMLELHTKRHGYKEISPPYLVNRSSMTNTGQLPKLEPDMYRLKDDDMFLVPTAEVPVTNIHADEVLEEGQLPIYYTAYTACFRREAGSYGKDTRGLTRVHQFDKVELVKLVRPQDSYDELEKLLKDAEEVLQLLNLPYRVVLLSTEGVSFAASKCYDIEAWSAGGEAWLEVSSCSNFEDFQARRANIRYKDKAMKKTRYVHTLNGSGVALARLVIAILENYQNADGMVTIPEALRPYMGGQELIGP